MYAAEKLTDHEAVLGVHTKVMSKTDYLFFPLFCLC